MRTTKWAAFGAILACVALATSCDDEPWILPITVSCEACHDGDPAPVPTSGNHTTHVVTAGYACTKCHDGYDTQPTHENGSDETTGLITFDAWNPGGTYIEGTSSCSSLYCHGPATVDWGGSAPACGDCHTVPPTSGSHVVHTGNDFSVPAAPEYNFACSECHKGAGDGTALHVNFTVDVVLDPFASSLATGYGANGGNTPTWNPGAQSCSNVYCHSNGVTKEKGGTYLLADIGNLGASAKAGTLSYNTPTWGGSVSCGDCHAGAPLGTPLAAGDYPNSGEHRRNTHSTAPNQRPVTGYVPCSSCHSTAAGDTLQGTYGSPEHVDGSLKFDPYEVPSSGTIQNPEGPDRSYQDSHCGAALGCWY